MPKRKRTRASSRPARRSLRRELWKISNHQVVGGLILAAALAGAAAIWGIISTTGGGDSPSTSGPPPGESTRRTFTAKVAWTDDGGGDGATTLFSYSGPTSHVRKGTYPLDEPLAVICQTPHGRAIQAGPDYRGPAPHTTTWYQLDVRTWVPAMYLHVDQPKAVPVCR